MSHSSAPTQARMRNDRLTAPRCMNAFLRSTRTRMQGRGLLARGYDATDARAAQIQYRGAAHDPEWAKDYQCRAVHEASVELERILVVEFERGILLVLLHHAVADH